MKEAIAQAKYIKGYSIALFCLGLVLLLGSSSSSTLSSPDLEADANLSFVSSILLLLASACIVVALLRLFRVPAALPATAALSLCLLIAFPFGTLLSIYWLIRVRGQELVLQHHSERTWFRYTVTLYIIGLLLLDAFLVFRWRLVSDTGDTGLLKAVAFGVLAMAVLCMVVATLRCFSARYGYHATFILSVLILAWFPLGTILALIWFFKVRKHERGMIYGVQSSAA